LVADRLQRLGYNDITNIQQYGGTILRTARCVEFKEDAVVEKAYQHLVRRGIEGMVLIGGDGSFRGGRDLIHKGLRVVGIPGSIDNDLTYTDTTIGFDSALNTILENVQRIMDSGESHTRVNVVEIMGRNCGDLPLYAALATGAMAVLVPEDPALFDDDQLVKIIENRKDIKARPLDLLILVSEGMHKVGEMNYTFDLARRLEARTGLETRATILGYLQRGGRPSAKDRVHATQMGYRAVQLLKEAIETKKPCERVMGIKEDIVTDFNLEEALSKQSTLRKPDFLEIVKKLSILQSVEP